MVIAEARMHTRWEKFFIAGQYARAVLLPRKLSRISFVMTGQAWTDLLLRQPLQP